MRKFSLSLLSLALLMAGCATVGPDYSGPPQGSVPQPSAFARAGDAALPSAPVAQWWTSLGDQTLNDLMTQALSASPSLDVARARLRQARSGLKLEQANEQPSLSATGMYAHARLPGFNLTGQPGGEIDSLDLYNVGFDASWEIDLYGAHRRAIESAGAAEQGAQANLADAQVSLTAEVANAYVNLRDRQWRIGLTRNSVAKLEQMLELTRQRYAGGTASKLDVARLESQLESTGASIAPLDADRQAYLDELAALLGQAPGELDAMLGGAVLAPLPPAQVAVGDPVTLLQRRPDIRAAERQLAADTAKIGQAEAAKFPSVKFMGILGLGGTHPEDLTKLDDFVGLISPQINWSFLDFGRNAARVDQAQGKRDEARIMLGEIYGWFTEGFDTPNFDRFSERSEKLGTGWWREVNSNCRYRFLNCQTTASSWNLRRRDELP